jgi:hypothetical protein
VELGVEPVGVGEQQVRGEDEVDVVVRERQVGERRRQVPAGVPREVAGEQSC